MEPEIVKVDVAAVTDAAPQVAVPTIDSQLETLETSIFKVGPVKIAERAIKHDAQNVLSHLGKIKTAYSDGLYREMHIAMTQVLYGLEILVDNISHPANLFGAAVSSNAGDIFGDLMNNLRNWVAVFEFVLHSKYPDQTKISAQRIEFELFLDSIENHVNNISFVKVFPRAP